MTSNVPVTQKNENQYVRLQLRIPGTQRLFSDNVHPGIDGFTDEPVVQKDVQILENTFVDDSK